VGSAQLLIFRELRTLGYRRCQYPPAMSKGFIFLLTGSLNDRLSKPVKRQEGESPSP